MPVACDLRRDVNHKHALSTTTPNTTGWVLNMRATIACELLDLTQYH
jgi:hypothetical protein